MHLFNDYVEPLTLWLFLHPNWALLITFLISLAESLAIIGSIIPGSITMTAIGILAGSGVMRIDLTLIAATLGAIAGDSSSYALGYKYSDHLLSIWPFRKYPTWISYGKEYFVKHGEISVIIGRFVGPIRSIIPVIAGMMQMKQSHFIVSNIISAIIWSILYVIPGVIIGAASSELSTEIATRLFIIILVSLGLIWIITIILKWLYLHAKKNLRFYLQTTWTQLLKTTYFGKYLKILTPAKEYNHFITARVCYLGFFCLILSVILLILNTINTTAITSLDQIIYNFSQTLRTDIFDHIFTFIILLINPLQIFIIILIIIACTIYFHDLRTLTYWLSLCISTILLYYFIPILHSNPIVKHLDYRDLLFPNNDLLFATSLLSFLIFCLHRYFISIFSIIIQSTLLILLLLAGFANVYLGNNFLSHVLLTYLFGFTLAIMHWIFYRRKIIDVTYSESPIMLASIIVILVTSCSYFLFYKKLLHSNYPQVKQYVLDKDIWWQQKQPLLPIYSTNRIGKKHAPINIQYVGSLHNLQHTLQKHGWKYISHSFFYNLLLKAGGDHITKNIPLSTSIYQNKIPILTMLYQGNTQSPTLLLRIWRSNYHIRGHKEPIWFGSILSLSNNKSRFKLPEQYLMQSLPGYRYRQVTFIGSPPLLLIRVSHLQSN